MAPELIENPHYSNKVDVYSYAIVLYQLLTLKHPYSDEKNLTPYNLFKNVQKGVRPTILDREIKDIYLELIYNCWSGDPDKRPSFIQIVKGFMDYKDEYFDMNIIDEEEFYDYIDLVTKDLDFSNVGEIGE